MLTLWIRSTALALAIAASWSAAASAETMMERGRYLVEGVVACGNCHSPRGPDGRLIESMSYAGQMLIDIPPFTAYAPNITPDPDTGIGKWSADDLKRAIREGMRPDGSIIGPPMPIELYREISDRDLDAIVTYIRSVPAVRNQVDKSTYRMPLPESYGPPVGNVADPDPSDRLTYGRYLVTIGHCLECHTPRGENGHPDYANSLGAGGFELPGPWGVSITANLTSHSTKGLGRYAEDADIKKIITTGVRPDGTPLLPPMAFDFYARISEADLDAMVAYLRTLPPKPAP